jgi:hypothetical protein
LGINFKKLFKLLQKGSDSKPLQIEKWEGIACGL